MQTFLPYSDFNKSARLLDSKRLGKQRVENLQIAKALIDPDYGWQNHPAVKMCRGHLNTFMTYQESVCRAWTDRNYKDTCLDKTRLILANFTDGADDAPAWLGDERVHLSHRSNLLRKDPEFYSTTSEATLSPDIEYYWPVQ